MTAEDDLDDDGAPFGSSEDVDLEMALIDCISAIRRSYVARVRFQYDAIDDWKSGRTDEIAQLEDTEEGRLNIELTKQVVTEMLSIIAVQARNEASDS